MPLLLALVACAASLLLAAPQASAATLTNPGWSVSNPKTSATGVHYTYTFTPATSSSLSTVTMTVPSGTAGSATVGTVSPSSISGGTISLAGGTLTYSFTSALVGAGTAISIQINGLTNTSTAGSGYASTITTANGAGPVDTGTTGTVTLTGNSLNSLTWSASSTTTGTSGVSYTYNFTQPVLTGLVITSITMSVPPGTSGTPALGSSSPSLPGATVALSGNKIVISGVSVPLNLSPIAFTIQITGLANTSTPGSYTSEITTSGLVGTSAGVTSNAVSFTGTLTLTSPSSLTWGVTLNGANQSVADAVSADQQLSVSDQTGSGAGWHITVAATTFTSGAHTLANVGTFVFTGSTSSVTATTAPSSACASSCTLPTDTTSYPVAITTASSPTPATVYDTSAGSGLGAITLGGHSATNPVGWWVNVPANAIPGSYTSTVTVAMVSGP